MHPLIVPACSLQSTNSPGEAARASHVALAASSRRIVAERGPSGAESRVRSVTPAGPVARNFARRAAALTLLAIGLGSAVVAAPNDPRYLAGDQWSLNNTGVNGGVAGADIMAAEAWSVLHDAPEIIVAVLDSGVRLTHEDLAGNLWVNPGESGVDTLGRDKRTNGVDDDGNGYVDDVHGINVLNHSGNPNDDWGHGTHVAGIVGAVGNNALGITGVTWRVKIMVCKFIDASGNYTVPDAITALDYARSKGAKVVTAAWGKTTFTSAALREAVIALRDANIILAAAAGNDGGNNDTTPLYPASYEYSNVIAAAATDRADALASFSNYGAQSVDLGAPGASVLSCWNGSDSDYRENSGTSFAAAHVAGACALLWARFPADTHQQIINRLITTADPLAGLAGKMVSGGRLNLAAALASGSVPAITSSVTASATVGTAFSYQITASNSATSYAATNLAGTGLSLNTTTGIISGTPTAAGTISSQLTATNSAGTSAAITLTITVSAAPAGDTTAPSISSFAFDRSTVTAISGSFVVTFSEPVTGVDAADFAFSTQGTASGTITGVTATSTTIYRVNFDYAGTSGSVQAAIRTSGTGIADTATNAFVGGGNAASDVVPFVAAPPADSTPPVASTFAAGTPTASAVTFTLTFSEPVTGVNAGDFVVFPSTALTATLGTVTANGAGTVYTIPVTLSGTGTLQLMALGGATANIRDAATNWFAGGSGQLSSTVTIGGGGSVPTITSAATASATVGTAFSYQITATHSPTSYAATNLAGTGLSLNTTTGVISGTPTTASPISSQLTAVNATGTSAAITLTITVSAAPVVPTITSAATASATVGTAFSYQITATHSPTSYAATNLAGTGLSLNTTTGVISGTPTTASPISSQLTAINATGTSAPVTLTITVAAAGSAPVISSSPTAGVNVGASFSYTITASNSPTSFSAANLPTGLVFTSPTITGAVSTAGTYNISLGAANAFGGDAKTLVLTIAATPPPGGGGGGGGGGGSAPASQQIIFAPGSAIVGEPLTLTATSSTGLPVSFTLVSGHATLVGSTLTPQNAGAIVVRAFNSGNASTSAASTHATINARHKQTLTFNSPVSAMTIHSPITLSAATSAGGLPITFTLVSGNATLSGSTLTPKSPGAIVVRASQAGSDSYVATSVETNFGSPGKAAQSITCPALSDTTAASGPIPVNATASSGLPISLSVSGPARLSGNTIVLAGASGTVTLRASAPGNELYNPAADLVRTFHVRAMGQQVYLGTMGSDPFAVVISQDGSTGMWVARLAASGEAIIARFALNADGTFDANATPLLAPTQGGVSVNATQTTAALAASRTIVGAVNNGVVSGTIAELDRSFTANVSAATGPTAALAGVYVACIPGSASGDAYLVAAPDGTVFAVVVTPSAVTSGSGTITNAGEFTLATSGGGVLAGTVDVSNGTLRGTLATAGTTAALVGLSEGTHRSDRLVNLSSRLRVVGGDASRSVIAGFVVAGTGTKPILVRAVGPGLTGFGVQDALANPRLQLYRGSTLVAENDDWSNNADVSATGDGVGAFKLAANSRDAALLATVEPGAYTAIVSGVNGNGVVLVEVYDAATGESIASQQLVNLSTRGFVDTGEGSLIAGFVVTGNAPKRVLIRGIGPGLTPFGVAGVLADPTLKIYAAGSPAAIAQNDDWSVAQPVNAGQAVASSAELSATATATGAFALPAGSKDSALLITLMPGNYTAVVSGANNTTGVGLVEVYELSNP